MSHRAVSQGQMGEQLKMFMTPDEVIDYAHKSDSDLFHHMDQEQTHTPREQWEHPGSGPGDEGPLRDEKLHALDHSPEMRAAFGQSWDTAPPLEIKRTWKHDYPVLSDGHHRLAHAERAKIPYVAVTHE